MTKASDNVFPRLLVSEGGSTSTPASGNVTVYAKANGLLYSKDDAGTETALGGGAGATFVGCRVYNSTTQNITAATITPATFDTEEYDTDAIHAGGAPTRITIPTGKDGKWSLLGGGGYDIAGGGLRFLWWRLNGTTDIRGSVISGGPEAIQSGITVAVVATDYLELICYQTSSGTRAFGNAGGDIKFQGTVSATFLGA